MSSFVKKYCFSLKKCLDNCKIKSKRGKLRSEKESNSNKNKSNNDLVVTNRSSNVINSINNYKNVIMNTDPNVNWTLLEIISDGGFSRIFKIRNKQNGTYAAAKIYEYCDREDLNEYMSEIDILNECRNNKNIIDIHGSYYFDSTLWMIIEYCHGGSLESVMNDLNKPLKEDQIQYVVKETLNALIYLHDTCLIIHRDVKAGNILLTENGLVKLSDFSLAAINSHVLQRRKSFIGSPLWMSPEVIACENDKASWYDNRVDVWSLGITCIELAEQKPPFDGTPPSIAMLKILKSDWMPKLSQPQLWSKKFNRFISKCLIRDKKQRFLAQQLIKHKFITSCKRKQDIMISLLKERNELIKNLNDNKTTTINDNYTESIISNDSVFEPADTLPTEALSLNLTDDDIDNQIVVKSYHTNHDEDNNSLIESIFNDLCLDVINSEYERPSVPDCILDIIKELIQEEEEKLLISSNQK